MTNQAFLDLTEIDYPIIQAPMAGGPTTPELVAGVSNYGALGSLGGAYLSPDDLRRQIKAIKAQTAKRFAVNFFSPTSLYTKRVEQQAICHILKNVCRPLNITINPVSPPYTPDFDAQVDVIIEENVPIFSCIFGLPSADTISRLKTNKTLLIGTATNSDEAIALAQAGFDAIVAQGVEAGGHRGTFNPAQADEKLSTSALVKQLTDAVNLPIIAAGGIATGDDVKIALSLGASACQLGTAFLTTHESGASPTHKQALLSLTDDTTQLTRAFSGRFARGIRNDFMQAMASHQNDVLPFPAQNKLTKQIRQAAVAQNNAEFMSLWAGKNAKMCEALSVSELIDKLINHL